jgi:hypothetical protein
MDQIQEIRHIFKEMPKEFDFHQCFYYMKYLEMAESHKGAFKLHQRYVQA